MVKKKEVQRTGKKERTKILLIIKTVLNKEQINGEDRNKAIVM